jgi:hypothetical protein
MDDGRPTTDDQSEGTMNNQPGNDANNNLISPELAGELAETAATLGRLGVTLVNVPVSMLPRRRREQVKQVAGELANIGAILPKAVGGLLGESEREGKRSSREDLGSRLRRERREQEEDAPGGAAMEENTGEDEAPLPNEEEATEEVEENIQDAWNDPPLEPGEQTDEPEIAQD